MPPRAKYTKEEIIQTAFEMTREKGFGAVTARALGEKLGTSVTPIFNAFQNMGELQREVRNLAMKEFEKYVADAVNYTPAFKQFGVQMIKFATEEPQLFRILYMDVKEESQSFEVMIEGLGASVQTCMALIQQDYGVSEADAVRLFRQAWIHTFAICVLLVNKICCFSRDEIMDMLGLDFQGSLMLIKADQYRNIDVISKK